MVSWREDGDDAEFTLTSSSSDNGYLALGFSSDSKMVSLDVELVYVCQCCHTINLFLY